MLKHNLRQRPPRSLTSGDADHAQPQSQPHAPLRLPAGRRAVCGRRCDPVGRHVAIPARSPEQRRSRAVVRVAVAQGDPPSGHHGRGETGAAQSPQAVAGRALPPQRLHRPGLVPTRRGNPRRLARQARAALAGTGPLGNAGLAGRPQDRHGGQPDLAPGPRPRHRGCRGQTHADHLRRQPAQVRPRRLRLHPLRRHADQLERTDW